MNFDNFRKCLKEEIHKDVLVTGEYDVTEVEGQKVNINNDCLKPKHNNPCC